MLSPNDPLKQQRPWSLVVQMACFNLEKGSLADVGHIYDSRWHMKCVQHAANNDGVIQTTQVVIFR